MVDKIGLYVLIGLLWAASMIYMYRDMSQRNLPGWQQSLWVVISLVPFVGLLAYLVARLAGRSASRRPASAPAGPRVTLVQDPGQRPATIAVTGGQPAAGQPAISAGLAATEGAHRGQNWTIRQFPACVGRDIDCAVKLEQDLAVSRRHAEFYVRGSRLWIRDLGSTHGTFVNGQRVGEQPLSPGDKLRLGSSLLEIKPGR